jgi:hypothetical protein
MKLTDTITLKMTRKDAIELGLLTCECGHPENNHFDMKKKPCAHCKCNEYSERSVRGTLNGRT